MTSKNGPLRVGIGGPVGSGKTTLTEKLCKAMRDRFSIAVVTNDIYTKEDAMILARLQALPEERIVGVETALLSLAAASNEPKVQDAYFEPDPSLHIASRPSRRSASATVTGSTGSLSP